MEIVPQEVIKVNEDTMTVSARDLHEALGIVKRFSQWFEQFKEDFTDGTDFTSVPTSTVVNNGAVRELNDFQVSIEMAKHICMMSHTDKGKQMRQYFIDLEKAWNTPELVMARGLKAAQAMIVKKEEAIKILTADNEAMKPKALFADAVSGSKNSILIGELAKLITQNGYEIGQNRLFQLLRNGRYLYRNGKNNVPYQRYVEQGLFEMKETVTQNADAEPIIRITTKVTGKGQQYFIDKFLNA